MLRASSLGLSLPSPNIFAVQQCRRLSGARSRWAASPRLSGRTIHYTGNPTAHLSPSSNTPGREFEESAALNKMHGTLSDARNTHRSFSRHSLPHEENARESRPVSPTRFQKDVLRPIIRAEEKQTTPPVSPETLKNGSQTRRVPPPLKYDSIDAAMEVARKRAEDHTYQPDSPPIPGLDPALELEIWTNMRTMSATSSVDDAWSAYLYLVDAIHQNPVVQEQLFPHIKFALLHRLCRLLAGNQPKTHRQYLRLLSVMTYINYYGGPLQQFEFSALIDNAGKGWRKVHYEDFAHARGVFNDLTQGRLPTISDHLPAEYSALRGVTFQPDVYTLTSLASQAARAGDPAAMRGVFNAFDKHGIAPNRITYLSQLKYYILKRDLPGLRMALRTMRRLDIDLGVDGLNQCMSGYSQLGKVDVTIMIYRLMRHNLNPSAWEYGDEDEIDTVAARLGEEYIFVEDAVPDAITYQSAVQAMSYHGHFRLAIEALLDMLSTPNDSGSLPSEPTMEAYRSLFMGFKKYGVTKSLNSQFGWTYGNLREIFQKFLELPPGTRINHFTLLNIMAAFEKCGKHDDAELRIIWNAVHDNFDVTPIKPHSTAPVALMKQRLFSEDE